MIKEKICIGTSMVGCVLVLASAVFLSVGVFVIGFGLMMGSMAMLA